MGLNTNINVKLNESCPHCIYEIMLGCRNKMAHGENDSLDKKYGIEVADTAAMDDL